MSRRRPFFKTLALSFMLVTLCLAGIYFYVTAYTDQDREEYLSLMKEANPGLAKNTTSTPYTATQQHHSMRKDIFFMQNDQRMQLELCSSHADLSLNNSGTDMELIEVMQNVVCYMQEELYPAQPDAPDAIPMQMIRYFEADHATYSYKSGNLKAQAVKISRYLVPGHTLTDQLTAFDPVMQGTAAEVQLSLKGSELNFQARDLIATFTLVQKP